MADRNQPRLHVPPSMETPLKDAFDEFHAANPFIWDLFVRFAFEAINAGRNNFGAKAIMERVRWEANVVTRSTDGLKINNNHTAYYSRLFIQEFPEHTGFMKRRRVCGEYDQSIPPNVHILPNNVGWESDF